MVGSAQNLIVTVGVEEKECRCVVAGRAGNEREISVSRPHASQRERILRETVSERLFAGQSRNPFSPHSI